MKRGAWVNLALFVAVVALSAFAYFKPEHKTPAFALSPLKVPDARSIQIENMRENAGSTIQLERENAGWNITTPIQARADDFMVARLLNVLNATSDTELPADDISHFNLDQPHAKLTIDGQTFEFGMFNEISRQQYVLTQNHVYLVGLQYGLALPKDAYQLADKRLFADGETPASFVFPNFKLEQNAGAWQLTPKANDYSQDDFNRWVAGWRDASALAVLPRDAVKHKPLATLRIVLQNQKIVTLRVLQTKPAFLLARDDVPALLYQFPQDVGERLLNSPDKTPASQ